MQLCPHSVHAFILSLRLARPWRWSVILHTTVILQYNFIIVSVLLAMLLLLTIVTQRLCVHVLCRVTVEVRTYAKISRTAGCLSVSIVLCSTHVSSRSSHASPLTSIGFTSPLPAIRRANVFFSLNPYIYLQISPFAHTVQQNVHHVPLLYFCGLLCWKWGVNCRSHSHMQYVKTTPN